MFHTVKNIKLGNMKKAQDFLIYPTADKQDYWILQSSTRIMKVSHDGTVKLSTTGNKFHDLNFDTIELTDKRLTDILSKIDLSNAGHVTQFKTKEYNY